MSAIERYFSLATDILSDVLATQKDKMEAAAQKLKEAMLAKQSIFAFGCNHAGMLAFELFYRAGGLVTINPIRAAGMMLEMTPITMTTDLERLDGYGKILLDNTPIQKGDVLLLHSVTGRNPIIVEMAQLARERGIYVIAITNMRSTLAVPSRHKSGLRLFEVADLVIDNCGVAGDAALEIEGVPEKTGPTSTVVGAAIVNAIAARTIELLVAENVTPPIFVSANAEGGDEHNQKVLAEYADNIFYMR